MIDCEEENCRDRPASLATGARGALEEVMPVARGAVDRVGASVKVLDRSDVADNRTSLPGPTDMSLQQVQVRKKECPWREGEDD